MLTCGEGHPGACHRAWGSPTEASTWRELHLSVSRGAGLGRVGQAGRAGNSHQRALPGPQPTLDWLAGPKDSVSSACPSGKWGLGLQWAAWAESSQAGRLGDALGLQEARIKGMRAGGGEKGGNLPWQPPFSSQSCNPWGQL